MQIHHKRNEASSNEKALKSDLTPPPLRSVRDELWLKLLHPVYFLAAVGGDTCEAAARTNLTSSAIR
jgi:hypothetical protein